MTMSLEIKGTWIDEYFFLNIKDKFRCIPYITLYKDHINRKTFGCNLFI